MDEREGREVRLVAAAERRRLHGCVLARVGDVESALRRATLPAGEGRATAWQVEAWRREVLEMRAWVDGALERRRLALEAAFDRAARRSA